MYGKIQINLERQEDLIPIIKGTDYYDCLREFSMYLQNEIDHIDHTNKEYELLEKIRKDFVEFVKYYNIDLT
jgi:hypothetical protein